MFIGTLAEYLCHGDRGRKFVEVISVNDVNSVILVAVSIRAYEIIEEPRPFH